MGNFHLNVFHYILLLVLAIGPAINYKKDGQRIPEERCFYSFKKSAIISTIMIIIVLMSALN